MILYCKLVVSRNLGNRRMRAAEAGLCTTPVIFDLSSQFLAQLVQLFSPLHLRPCQKQFGEACREEWTRVGITVGGEISLSAPLLCLLSSQHAPLISGILP